MASRAEIADYILGQISSAGKVRVQKMFGEYGVYCDEKVIAFICDDQLYLKPTEAGRVFLGEVEEAPPYPGAKNWFLIPEDTWDDAEWLTKLVMVTTPEVPPPKKKKKN
jgi:DNA transformation protein